MTDKFQDIYRIPSARLRNWDYSSNGIYFITICTAGHDHYFGEINNDKIMLSEIGLLVDREWLKSFDIRLELFCDLYVIMPNHIHAILRINNLVSNDMDKYLDSNSSHVFPHDRYVETHGRASLPSTTPSLPSTTSSLPSTTPSLPSTTSSLPSTTPSLPSTTSSIPSTTSSIPSATPSLASLALPDSTQKFRDITDSFILNISSTSNSINQITPPKISETARPLKSNKSGIAFRPPKSISSFIAGFKSAVTVNARYINSGFAWQTRFHDHLILNDREYFAIAFYIKNNQANWDKDELYKP